MKTFILQITNYNHPRKVALTISGYFTQQVRISRRNLLVGFLVWIFSARKIPGGSFFKFLAEGTYSRESGESGESTDSASSFPRASEYQNREIIRQISQSLKALSDHTQICRDLPDIFGLNLSWEFPWALALACISRQVMQQLLKKGFLVNKNLKLTCNFQDLSI